MPNHDAKSRLARAAATALCLSLSALAPSAARAEQPAASRARAGDPASALVGRLELEGDAGLAIPFESNLNTGFKLNGAALYGVQLLGPGTLLQVGANLGWTRNAYGPASGSINAIDLLPQARLRIALNPQVFLVGDLGIGLGIVRSASNGFSNTDAALLVKLGGGVGFDLSPGTALLVEPAFHFYSKSSSITEFTLTAGILHRL